MTIQSFIGAGLPVQFGIFPEKIPKNGCNVRKTILGEDNKILSRPTVFSVIKYGYVGSITAMNRKCPG
jgi:hypothetical protein